MTEHAVVPRRAWVERVMGMPVSIHVRGDGARGAEAADAAAVVYAELREADRIFSTYREDSDVSRLRRGEVTLADCDPLVDRAVSLGAVAQELTGGAFTTLRPTGEGDLAFDPTGLVKGWAVERAAAALATVEGLSYCVNAGGDLVVGAHPDLPLEGPEAVWWRVGIEDPHDRNGLVGTLRLTAGAVATSGTAARGAHLYDPTSGRMVERAGSVTVTGPSLLWADVWATALFVGGEGVRERFASRATDYLATEI